jgi:hypothetical protein
MENLPADTQMWQIRQFFSQWKPLRVKIHKKKNSASVYFLSSNDAVTALKGTLGTLFYGSRVSLDFGNVSRLNSLFFFILVLELKFVVKC